MVAFFRGKKNPASLKGYPGLCEPLNQRLAMYMVISKPKRMSTNDGVVHCMKYPPLLY